MLAAAADVSAQRQPRACTKPAPILVAFPRSTDKATAARVRDQLWSTFNDFKGGAFCLVPTQQVDGMLTQSTWPVDSVLPALDYVLLANQLRADAVLEWEATPMGR